MPGLQEVGSPFDLLRHGFAVLDEQTAAGADGNAGAGHLTEQYANQSAHIHGNAYPHYGTGGSSLSNAKRIAYPDPIADSDGLAYTHQDQLNADLLAFLKA